MNDKTRIYILGSRGATWKFLRLQAVCSHSTRIRIKLKSPCITLISLAFFFCVCLKLIFPPSSSDFTFLSLFFYSQLSSPLTCNVDLVLSISRFDSSSVLSFLLLLVEVNESKRVNRARKKKVKKNRRMKSVKDGTTTTKNGRH